MRQIKVTYRAEFAQPVGPLNPSGLKVPGRFPVEVFGANENWQAREIQTAARVIYKKLRKFASSENARSVVAESFAEQLTPWQTWGTIPAIPGQTTTHERMLEPGEFQVLPDGRVLIKEPDDYLHIIHAPSLPAGERVPSAACGAKVKAESFINNRANVEPTCKKCAEVWRREYKGR